MAASEVVADVLTLVCAWCLVVRCVQERAVRDSLVFVAPYDDPHTIAGQGTIGDEILRQVRGVWVAAGSHTQQQPLHPCQEAAEHKHTLRQCNWLLDVGALCGPALGIATTTGVILRLPGD